MRHHRPALAITAALSLTLLAGCAPAATPEEQAVQQMSSFVDAINGDGDVAWCDGSSDNGIDLGGWELVEGEKVTAEPSNEPNIWTVRATTHVTGDDSQVDEQSILVKVPEEGDPCVVGVYGFADISG